MIPTDVKGWLDGVAQEDGQDRELPGAKGPSGRAIRTRTTARHEGRVFRGSGRLIEPPAIPRSIFELGGAECCLESFVGGGEHIQQRNMTLWS